MNDPFEKLDGRKTVTEKFLTGKGSKFLTQSWPDHQDPMLKDKLRQDIKAGGKTRIITDDGDDFCYIKITRRTNGIYKIIYEDTVGLRDCLELGALIKGWEIYKEQGWIV